MLLNNQSFIRYPLNTVNPALGTIDFSDLNLPVFQQITPLGTINFSDLNLSIFQV